MIVITAVENRMGTMFNGRRLSRDREMIRDVAQFLCGRPLCVSPYSRSLFADSGIPLTVREDFLQQAGAGEVCFAEGEALAPYTDAISTLDLYRWNRDYPHDRTLDVDLSDYRLTRSTEFAGYSHETITREVYEK